jgi:hypothetical protein
MTQDPDPVDFRLLRLNGDYKGEQCSCKQD